MFPTIDPEKRRRMLTPRKDQTVRIVIDSDMANEIDDQFTLAWALMSQDVLEIEGVYAEPYSFQYRLDELKQAYEILHGDSLASDAENVLLERYRAQLERMAGIGVKPHDLTQPTPGEGMEQSYHEILNVYEKMGIDSDGIAFRGSDRYMGAVDNPVKSDAAEHLIDRALASHEDNPLYVVAIGCPTNVASAMVMAPEIIEKMVVTWTAAFPTTVNQGNFSFNLDQDLVASQLLFSSGVPLVYLPGFHVGAQLRISLPEMVSWVRGKGAIGDYLYHLYTNNPIHPMMGINDHFARTWVIWDLINIAWLLNPAWVPTELTPTPILGDDHYWYRHPHAHLIREAYAIDRDAIFRDFLSKLADFAK